MPSTVQHLTLDTGLQVTLRHAPQLKRCAAAVRVFAGSHDAARSYPGLAHFLEHLLFLGTVRFPLDDGLMRYVQRHGGQVNASTRERTTDYFFEVPQAAFAGGLERLCDMLAHPVFDPARQVREREVIHAEFIAWSRNAQAQAQFSLLQNVSRQHPLSAFHAGNRYTLPVHSHAFQAALQGLHRRFYQSGQMVLSLSGPQSLDALKALAHSAAGSLAMGERIKQSAPPTLIDTRLTPKQSGQHLDLLHAVEHQPEGMEQAIEFLSTWLTDTRAGGLLAALRQRNWAQSLECSPLYGFAGQALLHTRLQLTNTAMGDQAQALLQDWLRFLRSANLTSLKHEYAQLQTCREQGATALELACRDSAAQPYQALSTHAEQALRSLLDHLLKGVSPPGNQPWHLPAPEPLFNVQLPARAPIPTPLGLSLSPLLPPVRQQGVVYLRWQLSAAVRDRLWHVFDHALRPLRERAARAGVRVQFERLGQFWQLRCAGGPEAVVMVTDEALALLHHPDASSWVATDASEPDSMPIRTLLRQLPEQLVGQDHDAQTACSLSPHELDALWANATWQGLATGFDDHRQQALNHVLQHVPGRPGPHRRVALKTARRWHTLPTQSTEPALLLFCPVAATHEAAARLLAQHIQGPFYQRLRVELQLGYAVFSTFRQLQGCSGLVFGLQSPNASHAQILNHILEFLTPIPASLSCSTEARQALAEQMDEATMSNVDVAEWAWQAQLAGRPQADLKDLQAAILAVDDPQLRRCAADILQARHGWLCLANAPAPTAQWQAAD